MNEKVSELSQVVILTLGITLVIITALENDVCVCCQVAMAKDPKEELSRAGPVGVIPAGTLLKTEFSTFIPTPGGDPSEKTPPVKRPWCDVTYIHVPCTMD